MATATLSSIEPKPRKKPRREDLKPGEALCSYCTAKCCRYFALPIDVPKTKNDFDYMRWYLLHDGASIFTEDDCWYVLVHARCKMLRDDNLCAIYQARPTICREYTTENCEYEDEWCYERYFETAEQVEEYAEAVLDARNGQFQRSPKPELLNVL